MIVCSALAARLTRVQVPPSAPRPRASSVPKRQAQQNQNRSSIPTRAERQVPNPSCYLITACCFYVSLSAAAFDAVPVSTPLHHVYARLLQRRSQSCSDKALRQAPPRATTSESKSTCRRSRALSHLLQLHPPHTRSSLTKAA